MQLSDEEKEELATLGPDITEQKVIAKAREEGSTLSHHFKFDDVAGAAMEHWKKIARTMIRVIMVPVPVKHETRAVPQYYRNPTDTAAPYVTLDYLKQNPDMTARWFIQDLRPTLTRLRNARANAETLGMLEHLDRAITSLECIVTQLEAEPERVSA